MVLFYFNNFYVNRIGVKQALFSMNFLPLLPANLCISKKKCIFAEWATAHRVDIVFENQTYSHEEDAEKSPAADARRPCRVGKPAHRGLQEQRQHVRPQADQQRCHREVEHQGQRQQQG